MSFPSLVRSDNRYAIRAEGGAFQAVLVYGNVSATGSFTSIQTSERTEPEADFIDIDGVWMGIPTDFTAGLPPAKKVVIISGTKYYVVDTSVDTQQMSCQIRVRRTS